MATAEEKKTVPLGEMLQVDSSNPKIFSPNDGDKEERTDLGSFTNPNSEEHYPHGLKLFILAGASMVAVFLIALDQVSGPTFFSGDPTKNVFDTAILVDYRWHCDTKNHR